MQVLSCQNDEKICSHCSGNMRSWHFCRHFGPHLGFIVFCLCTIPLRLTYANRDLFRFPRDVSRYTTMSHTRDASNPVNAKRYILLRHGRQRFAVDGLNSLRYKLVAKVPGLLYPWLLVNLLPSQINLKGSHIQSKAPNYAMKKNTNKHIK